MQVAAPTADALTASEQAAAVAGVEALCWSIACKWHTRNPDIDLEDLAAWARYGMVYAAARFQPARGLRFTTFATNWAQHFVRQYVHTEVARGMHVPAGHGMVRLCVASADAPSTVIEADGGHRDAKSAAGQVAAREEVEQPEPLPADFWEGLGKGAITARERTILALRYRDKLGLREVAERVGISKERVRQLIAVAVSRLRDDARTRALWDERVAG